MLNVNDMNYRPGATVADLMQTGDFTIKDLIYKVKDDIGTLDWWNNKLKKHMVKKYTNLMSNTLMTCTHRYLKV
jgi:hypothetical protein